MFLRYDYADHIIDVCTIKKIIGEFTGKNPELDPVLSVQMRKMKTQVKSKMQHDDNL